MRNRINSKFSLFLDPTQQVDSASDDPNLDLSSVDQHNDDSSTVMSTYSADRVMKKRTQPLETLRERQAMAIKLSSKKLMDRHSSLLTNSFESKYILGEKLGEGMHSSVYKCYSKFDVNKSNPYAVKISKSDDEEK